MTCRRPASSRRPGARHDRHFQGDEAGFAELEDLSLNMEGVAVWSHFRLARHDPAIAFFPDAGEAGAEELIARARDGQGYWSQEEGFALVLLLDQLVPAWREPVLGPSLASPWSLLERAVATD